MDTPLPFWTYYYNPYGNQVPSFTRNPLVIPTANHYHLYILPPPFPQAPPLPHVQYSQRVYVYYVNHYTSLHGHLTTYPPSHLLHQRVYDNPLFSLQPPAPPNQIHLSY